MKQMVCSVCSYTYDEAKGMPEAGIAPGTKWEDLPADWKCPWCGAGKEMFREKEGSASSAHNNHEKPHVDQEVSPMELSIIFSNLAQGCEKQYMPEQAEAFLELARYFQKKAESPSHADTTAMSQRIEDDLNARYPYAYSIAMAHGDRGALRALTWSEKVTRITQSLLTRYQKEGAGMLDQTSVYVCSVCGFIYVDNDPPERCPVCKVPDWKFERIEGRG